MVVDDERGRAGFDDRPAVAVGPHGRLWVAWSHGPAADRCQVVGHDDAVWVTSSADGGTSFDRPWSLPRLAGGAAFGTAVVPVGAGRAVLVWSEVQRGL